MWKESGAKRGEAEIISWTGLKRLFRVWTYQKRQKWFEQGANEAVLARQLLKRPCTTAVELKQIANSPQISL